MVRLKPVIIQNGGEGAVEWSVGRSRKGIQYLKIMNRLLGDKIKVGQTVQNPENRADDKLWWVAFPD